MMRCDRCEIDTVFKCQACHIYECICTKGTFKCKAEGCGTQVCSSCYYCSEMCRPRLIQTRIKDYLKCSKWSILFLLENAFRVIVGIVNMHALNAWICFECDRSYKYCFECDRSYKYCYCLSQTASTFREMVGWNQPNLDPVRNPFCYICMGNIWDDRKWKKWLHYRSHNIVW